MEDAGLWTLQFIARTILDTLRSVTDTPEDVEAVLKVMNRLADDPEPSVRAELMEQVPHIAMYCQEFKAKLAHVVPDSLLPMVVKFLTDMDIQVRKTSQAALLVLLEQGLVEKSDVQQQVCPVIIRLTEADSLDDYRTEAVALLSKMAPLIGKEMSEAIFLERFAALCHDPLFHVRKVCAANFGDFSSVVGTESTEKVLLPKFFYLCEDGIWGVRKACADVFMPVSCVCSPSVRKSELSPIFINLLKDQSRWVRMTAYQALGPFISTFAHSNITALLHNDNGEIVITDRELLAQRLEDLEQSQEAEQGQVQQSTETEQQVIKSDCDEQAEQEVIQDMEIDEKDDKDNEEAKEISNETTEEDEQHLRKIVHSKSLNDLSPEEDRAKKYQMTSSESFNNFLYWRDPLPVLDELPNSPDEETNNSEEQQKKDDSEINTSAMGRLIIMPVNNQAEASKLSQPNNNNQLQDPALPRGPPATLQSIVPQLLVDHFVSMTDPSRAQTVDSEIAHHCAFSLPAVALTLGRNNWPLLRETYDVLAADMQWKVRRTLASSIHELGVILGQDAVVADLIPIFNGFLKDLDEVRIGLLKHLSDFLKLLPLNLRRDYLPKMSDFLYMDNDRNWRYRQELAVQLGQLVPLFTAEEVKTHLAPIAIDLIRDKVAAVRSSAVQVHSIMVKNLIADQDSMESLGLARVLLADLIGQLVKSESWIHRQTYASLALTLYQESSLDDAQFASDVLPNLMDLAEDKVPNVRLAVARSLKQLQQATYFTKEANPHHARMERVIQDLTEDNDPDVKAFFGEPSSHLEQTAYDSDGQSITDISSQPV